MKRLTIFVGLCVALGCGKKTDQGAGSASASAAPAAASGRASATPGHAAAAPAAADCDKLGARTAEMSMGETPAGTPPDRVAKLQAISDEAGRAIATLCKTDGWSAAAVACGLAAKDPARECDDKLTDVQKKKMQVAVMAIFSKAAPP